jgi:hypothetical protein
MKKFIANKKNGSVSLFVVVFAAMLMTIVTVSFVGLMLNNQKQATTVDLSQSAYDSALAGVEDAKRALLEYQTSCNINPSSSDCTDYINSIFNINTEKCNDAISKLSDLTDAKVMDGSNISEVRVQSNGTNALNQAYTCVKVSLNNPDYLGKLSKDVSKFIPLVGEKAFDTVKIEWFTNADSGALSLPSGGPSLWPLLYKDWQISDPSIMRAQLIWFSGNFSVGSLASSTLFLYPSSGLGATLSTASDSGTVTNGVNGNTAQKVHCDLASAYRCSTTIKLPSRSIQSLYLNLTALYNGANYRVSLIDSTTGGSGSVVNFLAVQPEIDSTGRANDSFRRIKTRVELTNVSFAFPNAAINISNSFCKDFSITDNINDYNTNSLSYGSAGSVTQNGKCAP